MYLQCPMFIDINRQDLSICAKTVSSWVKKVIIAKGVYMYLVPFGVLWCLMPWQWVSIVQNGDWTRVSNPARPYFSMPTTTTYQYQESVQCAVLGLNE